MMKKLLVVLSIMCVFAAGFVLGDRSWDRLRIFKPVVIKPDTPASDELSHFLLSEIPRFSSEHYYFREGFTDVDEYWSFCLPPERARTFLTAYVEKAKLPLVKDPIEMPDFVLGSDGQREWDNRYLAGS